VRAGRATALLAIVLVASACLAPKEHTGGRAPAVKKMLHEQPPVPRVLVNQLGYLPARAKVATVRSDAAGPLEWTLLDGRGDAVARGKTVPFGADRLSGDAVHLADFSAFHGAGDGYVLDVGAQRSHHSAPTSIASSSTTRWPSSTSSAAASPSRCPTRAASSG
jgi:hypothetical protein